MLFRVHLPHYENLITHHPSHFSNQSLPSFAPTEPSSSVHNDIKLLKEENRRLSDINKVNVWEKEAAIPWDWDTWRYSTAAKKNK